MRELNVNEIEQVNGGAAQLDWWNIFSEVGEGALTGGGPVALWTRRLGAPGAILTGGIVGAYYGYEEVMRQLSIP
jgi:hypothetical protein